MLYCNCHYRYKDQLCELVSFLPHTGDKGRKVRIRLRNDREISCLESDLEEIPLTESILQSCYKMKTIIRDGEWDVLWNLGGKNNVTVGEKGGKYYLIPSTTVETVVEILPRGMVQGYYVNGTTELIQLQYVSHLKRLDPTIIKFPNNKI